MVICYQTMLDTSEILVGFSVKLINVLREDLEKTFIFSGSHFVLGNGIIISDVI